MLLTDPPGRDPEVTTLSGAAGAGYRRGDREPAVAERLSGGGVVGALAGTLLALISKPRPLMLLMAVFAGSSAGAVTGKLPLGRSGRPATLFPSGGVQRAQLKGVVRVPRTAADRKAVSELIAARYGPWARRLQEFTSRELGRQKGTPGMTKAA